METIGAEGAILLEAIRAAKEREKLRQVRAMEVLRQVWVQQYWTEQDPGGQEHVRLRREDNQPPCEQRIQSPYDPEARYGAKRSAEWVGYKVHVPYGVMRRVWPPSHTFLYMETDETNSPDLMRKPKKSIQDQS